MTKLNNIRFLNAGYCRQLAYWTGVRSIAVCKFQAVVVYFEHPKHGSFLIDTGYDLGFFEATRAFPFRVYRWMLPTRVTGEHCLTTALNRGRIDATKLSGIFLSHFHPDHIGGLSSLPRLPLILRQQPLDELRSLSSVQQLHHGFFPQLFDSNRNTDIIAIAEKDFSHQSIPALEMNEETRLVTSASSQWPIIDYWSDGSLLMVDLPGHARGHTGFLLNSVDGPLFYIVDAAWNVDELRSGRQLPLLARRLQPNYSQYWSTQRKLFELAQGNSELKMLACHCPRTQSYAAKASS